MTRTIAGVPVWGWALGLAAFGGALFWFKKKQATPSTAVAAKPSQPAFSQQQEVQDFQIFSQLTQSQQASDLSFVGQMLSLFGGGSSVPSRAGTGSGAAGGGGSVGGGSSSASPPPAAASTPAPPSGPIQPYKTSGSGVAYGPGVATTQGYYGIATGAAAGAAERSGQTLYFSPAAGQFVAVTPQSNLLPTTELFLK